MRWWRRRWIVASLVILLLGSALWAWAGGISSVPIQLIIQTIDGGVSGVFTSLKVTNGTLTANGDGSATLNIGNPGTSGDTNSAEVASVDGQMAVFDGAGGKTIESYNGAAGVLKADAQGVVSPATAADIETLAGDSGADGATKGVSTYTAAHFNAAAGVVSLDETIVNAPYLTTTAAPGLGAETNLGLLTTGLLKLTVVGAAATPSTAVVGTDYQAPLTAGVDYVAPAGNVATATALAANGANCDAGQFPLGVNASGAAETCTALPTTITGTANQIAASAATGAITLSIPNNPTLPGTTTGTFSGPLTGNVTGQADTATALAANPAACGAGAFVSDIAADGTLTCAVPPGSGGTWGSITGTLADQTDLNTALTNRELTANKSDDEALGTSTTVYVTQRAIKAYVDGAVGAAGGGDITTVGNCNGPGACLDGSAPGGSTLSLYDGDSHKGTFQTANLTADRTYTAPNADATLVIADTGAANQFLTAISTGGVISKAQPAFSNLSGTASDAQVPDLNTLSTGLTGSRCVETTVGGALTVAAGACGTGGSTAFSALTTGENTGAAMTVGTGATLAPSGTGTITANALSPESLSLIQLNAALAGDNVAGVATLVDGKCVQVVGGLLATIDDACNTFSDTRLSPRTVTLDVLTAPGEGRLVGPETADYVEHLALPSGTEIQCPTGTAVNNESLTFKLQTAAVGGVALSWDATCYVETAALNLPLQTSGSGIIDVYKFVYHAATGDYVLIAKTTESAGESNLIGIKEVSGLQSLVDNLIVPDGVITGVVGDTATLAFPTFLGTETLQNKRLPPRITSLASPAPLTWTPDFDANDQYAITALAGNLSVEAPTYGTPFDGELRLITIHDDGTARTLTWAAGGFAPEGDLRLPTTTYVGKTGSYQFRWNASTARWGLVGSTIGTLPVTKFVTSFTNTLTHDVDADVHTFQTMYLMIQCWDSGTPHQQLPVTDVVIDDDDFDVHFTWPTEQSGYCVIMG